jgi:hypothetical protein
MVPQEWKQQEKTQLNPTEHHLADRNAAINDL